MFDKVLNVPFILTGCKSHLNLLSVALNIGVAFANFKNSEIPEVLSMLMKLSRLKVPKILKFSLMCFVVLHFT